MFNLVLSLSVLNVAVYACSDSPAENVPPAVTPDEPEDPETPEEPEEPVAPPVVPTGPYVYDSDLDYDSETYVEAYGGTPFGEAHAVPGRVEAEDFDEGAMNVAYFESDSKLAEGGYRDSHEVDVRADGSASGGYYIGDVQPGEWMCYTIDVQEAGTYTIDTYIVKGDGSEGHFYFEVDGRVASRDISMPLGNWTDFSQKATASDIQLTEGIHILKYFGSTPGNVDYFELKRTGEYVGYSNSFTYPVTKEMYNPLFVEFESPMYNSWLKGPLYTADASAHVWNIDGKEVLYVYASHDMEPAVGCDRMDRYHVFSTEDMVNWTDHGEIMNAATVRLHDGWGSDGFMWAPDCAYNPEDGTYYFYFPHPTDNENWNSTWRIGVAISKYPDKEFWVVGYVEGMPAHIDPCVFVDDDGQPYIYNGGGGECFGGKLNKNNWTRLDGDVQKMIGLEDFHEGAWVHKKDGVYYLSYADNNPGANRLRYATSDSPLGPWKYQGIYVGSTTCDTNHGSIVEYKGQWYAFYHTSDYSGQGNLRSVAVDKLYYNADGTIRMVEQTGGKP